MGNRQVESCKWHLELLGDSRIKGRFGLRVAGPGSHNQGVIAGLGGCSVCLKDHQKLGRRIYEIRSMVATIGEVAAKSGNVKVFKWALWNEYFHEMIGITTYS